MLFEIAFSCESLRRADSAASVGRWNRQKKFLYRLSLHQQIRRIKPALAGLTRETVVAQLVAVDGRLDISNPAVTCSAANPASFSMDSDASPEDRSI